MPSNPEQISWEKYYSETSVISFEENSFQYSYLALLLSDQVPSIIDPREPKNFLLGGFYPYNKTPEAFQECSRTIHKNPRDRLIYLDFNPQPLQALPASIKMRSTLLNLPFQSSIDFMFLDYTTDFMSDEQVAAFSTSAATALRRNGVSLIALRNTEVLRQQARQMPYIPAYPRTQDELVGLLRDMKFLGSMEGHEGEVLAFAPPSSDFKSAAFSIPAIG